MEKRNDSVVGNNRSDLQSPSKQFMTIRVSLDNWKRLQQLRIALEARNLDKVISTLLFSVNPFQTADKFKEERKNGKKGNI
jgi:hypothetical protein